MFHWICPECGREIPPSVKECPACDPLAQVTLPVEAVPPQPAAAMEPEAAPDPLLALAEHIRTAQSNGKVEPARAAVPTEPRPEVVSAGVAELADAVGIAQPAPAPEPVSVAAAVPPIITFFPATQAVALLAPPQVVQAPPVELAAPAAVELPAAEPALEAALQPVASPVPPTMEMLATPEVGDIPTLELAAPGAVELPAVVEPAPEATPQPVAIPVPPTMEMLATPGVDDIPTLELAAPSAVELPAVVEPAPEATPQPVAGPVPPAMEMLAPPEAVESPAPEAAPEATAQPVDLVPQAPVPLTPELEARSEVVDVPPAGLAAPTAVGLPPAATETPREAIPQPVASAVMNPLTLLAPPDALAATPAELAAPTAVELPPAATEPPREATPQPVANRGPVPLTQLASIDEERPPSGSWLQLAPLQDYTAAASRTMRPAPPRKEILTPDSGPRITLPGPSLPPDLVSLKSGGVATTVAGRRARQSSARLPGWLVSAMLMLGIPLTGGALLLYFQPLQHSNAESKAAVAPPAIATPAPAEVTPSHSLADFIEVTGFRIVVDINKKSEIHYLVVNHSAAELSDMTIYVTLRAGNAKPGQPPLSRFSFRAAGLGPFESKEMTSPIEKVSRSMVLPEWQDLRADVQIGQ
jgi:hypothetical protein